MISFLRGWMPPQGTLEYYVLFSVVVLLSTTVAARGGAWVIWRLALAQTTIVRRDVSERRRTTLRALIRSLMNGLAVLTTIVIVLGLFVRADALVAALGLFSAGLGFGARPYISDFLGGVVLLFEDQFALGDKVEIGDRQVVGVVERVSLRTTAIRGESGELWIVPNGDVRTIRNFSRGVFSPANVLLTVPTSKFDEALALLLDIITDPGPDVLEPPEIISEDGELGAATTTVMLRVKARYGCGPVVRRRLLARIQAILTEHDVLRA